MLPMSIRKIIYIVEVGKVLPNPTVGAKCSSQLGRHLDELLVVVSLQVIQPLGNERGSSCNDPPSDFQVNKSINIMIII